MSKFPWEVPLIVFAIAASESVVVYHTIQIENLKARFTAVENVFIKQDGEIRKVVLESVEQKFNAYSDGLHNCQSMCYGRMKSYEMNENEALCVCFSGFKDED